MSDPNFEHSEGNWDEFPNEPSWSEYQWRKYLKGSDRDTARFLSIYNSLKDQPNHLDEVAVHMGWDAEDISLTDEFSSSESTEEAEARFEENENAPYTLHRHPVIVVTRALYRYLHQSWEHYMVHNQSYVSPQLCWNYANSLHQAEMNVLLSIQALDLGDFGLTICHLKNSLGALNQTLALLNQVTHPNPEFLAAFRSEIHIRLFDLREVWIRVMSDCRTECKRRPGGDQD
jgi:hypothetical protein